MTGRTADPIDAAADYADRHNADALARHRAPQPAAVQSIDPEGHIVCRDCDEPIPPARLAAHPHALRCIDCQEDEDLRRRRDAR